MHMIIWSARVQYFSAFIMIMTVIFGCKAAYVRDKIIIVVDSECGTFSCKMLYVHNSPVTSLVILTTNMIVQPSFWAHWSLSLRVNHVILMKTLWSIMNALFRKNLSPLIEIGINYCMQSLVFIWHVNWTFNFIFLEILGSKMFSLDITVIQ